VLRCSGEQPSSSQPSFLPIDLRLPCHYVDDLKHILATSLDLYLSAGDFWIFWNKG